MRNRTPDNHPMKHVSSKAMVRYFFSSCPTCILIVLVAITLGFVIGYISRAPKYVASQSIRQQSENFQFIHPLLAVARPDNITSVGYEPLSKEITKYIDESKRTQKANSVSVFFSNYNKDTVGSFSLNETTDYAPASLLKVVIMIAYFKESETNPSILSKKNYLH